jgi:hypothetical protein
MLLAGKTHPGVPRPAGPGRVAPLEVLLYSDSEPSKSLTSSNQSEARSIKVQLAQKNLGQEEPARTAEGPNG